MNAARSLTSALFAVAVVVATTATMPAQANNRSTVKVINNSSHTVVGIFSSPEYRQDYGDTDLLGSYMLRPGYYAYVDFETADAENECVLDVLAKGRDGSKWTKKLNVCSATTWTLVD